MDVGLQHGEPAGTAGRAAEEDPASYPIVVGDDDLCVEEEIGRGCDIPGDQVAVLASRHRVAVVAELVVDVPHEIVQSSVVQGGEVGPRFHLTSALRCRSSGIARTMRISRTPSSIWTAPSGTK